MTDPKLKRVFQEAAKLTEGLPEGLRETAFNRAVDELLDKKSGAGRMPGGGPAPDETVHVEEMAQRRILGIPGSGFVLEKSVASLNLAAARLGMDEVSAEQIADILEERFGVHVSEGVVARALESADSVVARVRKGGETLYRVIHPDEVTDEDEDEEEDDPQPARPTPKSKVKSQSRPSAAKSKPKAKAKAKPKPKSRAKGTAQKKKPTR